jgi:hypothetical protein
VPSTPHWPSVEKCSLPVIAPSTKTLSIPWIPERRPPLACVLRLLVAFINFYRGMIVLRSPNPCSDLPIRVTTDLPPFPRKMRFNAGCLRLNFMISLALLLPLCVDFTGVDAEAAPAASKFFCGVVVG